MNNQDYETKKRECLLNFCSEHGYRPKDTIVQGVFGYAFDRAYALGKCGQVKEPIPQEYIEKAAQKHADGLRVSPTIPGVIVSMLHDIAKTSYLQGAQDFIGTQEKDADTVISGWVARDKNGLLSLFRLYRPERGYDYNGDFGEWGTSIGYQMTIPNRLFPDLTWESEPQEVEIIIKRKKNG